MRVIYTLEGYCADRYFGGHIDKEAGLEKFKNLRFPVEAYKKLCARLGLPDPIAEEKDAEDSLIVSQSAKEARGEEIIVDGLTVADVRRMCVHSAPIKSILVAAAKWHNIPNGNQQKRDDDALESCLNHRAKKDGWGTARDGGVAKDDLRVFVRYVTGNVKGSGQK